MKPTVYLETSVVSYLAARVSRDLTVASHQQITQDWWDLRSQRSLYVSARVHREAGAGDTIAAMRRTDLLKGVPVLELSAAAVDLATRLLIGAALPKNAQEDALHIALAAINGIDFLLTWNCKHIANAAKRPIIEAVCRQAGYEPPIICTPEELLGDDHAD
jgi:hypothetical protein